MTSLRTNVRTRLRGPVILAVAAIATAGLVGCSGSSEKAQDVTTTTTAVPELPADRPIDVQVPPGYDQATPAPLLILLHGHSVDGKIQDTYLGLTETVAESGMLYVYPDGTKDELGDGFWNATDACCGPTSGVDDVSYIEAIIATVSADYNVDPTRIYLAGHSNGGFMSYRMACEDADKIAAIVSIAGATFVDPDDCKPSEPVAVLQVHGTADDTIAYKGDSTRSGDYPGAEETVKTWAGYNGCSTTPDEPAAALRDIVKDLPPATVTIYSTDCEPGGWAELWTQPDGPHIPAFTPTFAQQMIDWLLAHPKPT